MLKDKLKLLGLRDHEASIYSTLLANSPANATYIAKKCRLPRSSVYTALSSLISKGLVRTSYRNEVKQFIAEDLESLKQLLKNEENELAQKKNVLEDIVLESKALKQNIINVPEVVVFEGKDGLKKIYLSMLRQSRKEDTMMIIRDEFVWQDEWKFIFDQEWYNRVKRIRQEQNIKTKLLINSSSIEKKKEDYYNSRKALEVKRLGPKNSVNNFAMYIIGDTVSILSTENNNLVGIRITNQYLANNYKTIFNNLWGNSY